jgi:hypothetical protein
VAQLSITQWTEDEAFAWIEREYGLSTGAAEQQLRIAYESGNVRADDETAIILPDGGAQYVPPRLSRITGGFVHRLLLSADDLRWQIRQQLGAPV